MGGPCNTKKGRIPPRGLAASPEQDQAALTDGTGCIGTHEQNRNTWLQKANNSRNPNANCTTHRGMAPWNLMPAVRVCGNTCRQTHGGITRAQKPSSLLLWCLDIFLLRLRYLMWRQAHRVACHLDVDLPTGALMVQF